MFINLGFHFILEKDLLKLMIQHDCFLCLLYSSCLCATERLFLRQQQRIEKQSEGELSWLKDSKTVEQLEPDLPQIYFAGTPGNNTNSSSTKLNLHKFNQLSSLKQHFF